MQTETKSQFFVGIFETVRKMKDFYVHLVSCEYVSNTFADSNQLHFLSSFIQACFIIRFL